MKRIGIRLLALLTAAVLLTGCKGIGVSAGTKPSENSVKIEKDGSVQWQSVETYEKGDYTEAEMEASLEKQISEYNSSLGKAAESRNTEGADKLPVALVSAGLGGGTAYSVTEYDSPGQLLDFAQEIGDYNVAFTSLETGRAAVMGQQLEGVSLKDEKGNAVDKAQALSDGQRVVVKAEGPGMIETEKKVLCASEGCQIMDSNKVKTPEEGTSFIVLN